MQDIIESRKELEEDFLDFWVDIETRLEDDFSNCWNGILSEIQLPNGFIKCSKCNSIIHNKYFKKYWGTNKKYEELKEHLSNRGIS